MNTQNTLSNNQQKYIRQLQQKKFREEERKFTVEGLRGVEEALKSDWEIEMVVSVSALSATPLEQKCADLIDEKGIPVFITTPKEFEKLSETEHSQGILAIVAQKNFGDGFSTAQPSLLVAFDAVSDPGNLGTMLRSCDWFGVSGVLLGKNCVELFNPKVVRATMGAIFHLPILTGKDLEKELPALQKRGFQIATATLNAKKSLFEISLPKQSVILFGSEAHGVSTHLEHLSNIQFTIPKYGKAESLNVAAACASVLTAWRMGK